jgi:reverse gyrase
MYRKRKLLAVWNRKFMNALKKQVAISWRDLRHHSLVDRNLDNIYREFDEARKLTNTLCLNCEIDEK